jgi:hypothetical protein
LFVVEAKVKANAAAAPVSLIAVLGQVSSTAHAWGMDRAQHAVELCRRRWGARTQPSSFRPSFHTGGPGRGARRRQRVRRGRQMLLCERGSMVMDGH